MIRLLQIVLRHVPSRDLRQRCLDLHAPDLGAGVPIRQHEGDYSAAGAQIDNPVRRSRLDMMSEQDGIPAKSDTRNGIEQSGCGR